MNEKNKILYEVRKKNPILAGILSFFVTGTGQMYNGEVGKGILLFLGSVVLWFVLMGWTVWIYSIWEANKTAKLKNVELALELKI